MSFLGRRRALKEAKAAAARQIPAAKAAKVTDTLPPTHPPDRTGRGGALRRLPMPPVIASVTTT